MASELDKQRRELDDLEHRRIRVSKENDQLKAQASKYEREMNETHEENRHAVKEKQRIEVE